MNILTCRLGIAVMFCTLVAGTVAAEAGEREGSAKGWRRWFKRQKPEASTNLTTMTTGQSAGARSGNTQQWQADITHTGPIGTSTVHATGSAVRTEDGSTWEVDRTGAGPKGNTWESTTTGQGTRTEDGRTWTSETTGEGSKGHTWETDRSGTVVKHDDGTSTRTTDFTKTLDNGQTITGEKTATITKTEDGVTWESEGSRTGPKGTSTFTGSGEGTRDGNTAEWTGQKTITGPDGKVINTETTGTGTRTREGRALQSNTEISGQTDKGNRTRNTIRETDSKKTRKQAGTSQQSATPNKTRTRKQQP